MALFAGGGIACPFACTSRLASGFRGGQSAGGKDTRQKPGQVSENSTPTSGVPSAPAFMSITVQANTLTSALIDGCQRSWIRCDHEIVLESLCIYLHEQNHLECRRKKFSAGSYMRNLRKAIPSLCRASCSSIRLRAHCYSGVGKRNGWNCSSEAIGS